MKKKEFNRITVMTIIFSLFLSLFNHLTFASSKTISESLKKLPNDQIVKLQPSESTVSFSLFEEKKVKVEAEFKDGIIKDVTKNGKWTSQDEMKVTVIDGVLKAVSTGTTKVQFKIGSAVTIIDVIVSSNGAIQSENPKPDTPKIVSLMLSAYNIVYLNEGEKKSIQLKALFSDGSVKDVTKSAIWNSRVTSIAEVSDGVLTGISPGDVALNVKYSNLPEINFFVSVKEKLVEEKGLILSVSQLRFEEADKPEQVSAYTRSNISGSKEVTSLGKWSTSNSNVVAVNSSGQVTPVGVGEAYIYFKYDKMVNSVLVNVVKPTNLVTETPILEILPNESVGAVLKEVFNDGILNDVTNMAKWTIEDSSLATVTEQGVVNARGKIGKTKLIASYRSEVHSPVEIEVIITNKLTTPRAIGLTTSTSHYFLGVGSEKEVSIKAVFSDGSIKDVTDSVEWSASNPIIASVELNKIHANWNGRTVLTAMYDSKIVQIPVTVADKYGPAKPAIPKSVTVTPNVTNMIVNEKQQLNVKVTYTDDSVIDDTPYSIYKTDNPSVVTINEDGLLTAVGTGIAKISVWSMGYTERLTIIVSETPSKVELNRIVDLLPNESDISLTLNEHTHRYSIKAKYQDGTTADVTFKGRSTSLNPEIVSVDNGVLTAIAPGTTQVLINQGNNTEILDVTILPNSSILEQDLKIESLLFNTFDVVVPKGNLFPLRISAQYNDGAQREITKSVQWTSNDPSIAVIEEGKITGKSKGSTTIFGKIEGFPAIKIPVTVNEKSGSSDLIGITLSEGMLMMQPGNEPVDVYAFAEYTDNNVVEVDTDGIWESTDESVATVDKNGKITPVGLGEAYVYFRYHNGLNDAVWVRNIKPEALISNVTDVELETNESLLVSLRAIFGPRDIFEVTDLAEWSVADKSVATISDTGIIIGQAVGKTKITASYLGKTVEINVEVVDKHTTQVLGIFAAPDYIVSSAGKKTKMIINAILSDGTIRDVTSEVTYRLSNPDIANTTTNNEIVTGDDGSAIVMAEYAGFYTIIPVVVNQ